MKYLPVILTALFALPPAGGVQSKPINQAESETGQSVNQTLIVFFDKQKTNAQTLLKQGEKWQIEPLYEYKNLHGIAFRVPNRHNVAKVKAFYAQTEGVLQVNEDGVSQLH